MSERSKKKLGVSIGAILVLALLVAGTFVIFSGGSATAKQIARLHIFEGQVEVDEGDGFSPGTEGQSLNEGDAVRTGADGRAEIEYFDDSVTRLDFNTTFELTTLEVLDNEAGSKVIQASQTAGGTYNRVTELTDSESRFDIETPTATASVQGTVYAVLFGVDGTTTIAVIEGVVSGLSELGDIEVPAGKMVVIGPDGTVGELQDIPEDFLNSDWILFNQCDVDEERDCVLGSVVTPEEPEEEEPEEPQDEPSPAPTAPTGTTSGDGGGSPTPNSAPEAGMVASALAGPAPHAVSFADASSDPDDDPLSRDWDFGDGSSHSGAKNVSHTYTEPGEYLATLTVSDPDGESDSVWALVQVSDGEAPSVEITGGPDNPSDSADATFTFTSSEAGTGFFCSLDGAPATACGGGSAGLLGLFEAFGGSLASVGGSVTYTNLADGPHGFTVSVTDAAGNTGSASWNWEIDTSPVLDHITLSPSVSTITLGGSQAYSVTAFDTDGNSMGNVTSSSVISGANCTGNVCTPTSVGDKTVTATYEGESDTALLHVVPPAPDTAVFDHIEISPSSATITYGESQEYTATAFDTDGASMGDVTGSTTFTGANCTGNVCTPMSAGPKTVTGTYTGSFGSDSDDASLTVNKKTLTVSPDPQSKTYGATDPAFSFSYSGFVSGDDAGDLDTPPACGAGSGPFTVAGSPYLITCSGGTDDNYSFSYGNASFTISRATLTVTADAKSKTQGTSNPPLTYTITGFVNGENESVLTALPTCATTATTSSPIGSYSITCSGAAAANYSFTYVGATLTVTARPVITVTATVTPNSITFGGTPPTIGFTYSPTPDSTIDTPPTCAPTSSDYPEAGNYTIACSGASDDVYDFSYVSASLTIAKASLSVVPDNVTITEGDTPSFTFQYSATPSISIDTPPTCGAGPGPFTAAGSPYTITCSGGSDDNYNLDHSATALLTVNPAGPGPVHHIVLSGSNAHLTLGCARPFTATLKDANGLTVDDDATVVTFTDSSGGNITFSGGATATTVDGVAAKVVTGAKTGNLVLQATALGLSSNTIQFQVVGGSCGEAVEQARTGGASGDASSSSDDRSRESGFRALGIVVLLPLVGLGRPRRRRH